MSEELLFNSLSNISEALRKKAEEIIKQMLRSGSTRYEIIEYLVKTPEIALTSEQIEDLIASVLLELRKHLIYSRQEEVASALYFLGRALLETAQDISKLDKVIAFLSPVEELNQDTGNYETVIPHIEDQEDSAIVNKRIELLGKMWDRKIKFRMVQLSYRKEMSSMLGLNQNSDMLKSIQVLMASNALPANFKNQLFDLFVDLETKLNNMEDMQLKQAAAFAPVEL